MNADLIIVAPDERRGMNLERLLECKKAGFPVIQYLSFVEREIRRIDLKRMELGWLVYTDGFTFGTLDRFLKRGFDLAVSSLVLLADRAADPRPAMIAIRWEGPGPMFYRQERVTRDGRIFPIMKLRTMRTDAEAKGAVWAMEKDNRITRAGNFPAAHPHRRTAAVDQHPARRHVVRRTASRTADVRQGTGREDPACIMSGTW